MINWFCRDCHYYNDAKEYCNARNNKIVELQWCNAYVKYARVDKVKEAVKDMNKAADNWSELE